MSKPKIETVLKWEHRFLDCQHYGLKSAYKSEDGGTQCLVCANKMRGVECQEIKYERKK